MNLSEKATENLVDSLKVTSLAVILVSASLISNAIVFNNSVTGRTIVRDIEVLSTLSKETGNYSANGLFVGMPEMKKQIGLLGNARVAEVTLDANVNLSKESPAASNERLKTNIEVPNYNDVLENDYGRQVLDVSFSEMKNIREAKKVWDFLYNVKQLVILDLPAEGAAQVWPRSQSNLNGPPEVGSPVARYRVSIPDTTDPLVEGRDGAAALPNPKVGDKLQAAYKLRDLLDSVGKKPILNDVDKDGNMLLWISFPYHLESVSPLELWFHYSKSPYVQGLSIGDFQTVFPGLAGLEQQRYENYNWEELREVLKAEKQPVETIELFGSKISNDLLVQFGLPVLAILQLHFALVCGFISTRCGIINETLASRWPFLLSGVELSVFSKRCGIVNEARACRWPSLLSGVVFLLFAVGMTTLLPIIAALFSTGFVTHHHWSWWIVLVAVFVFSVVAGLRLIGLCKNVGLEPHNVSGLKRPIE